ncbi:hypothetical protein R3P38DRAFT_2813297 [Favolaschia claudopus]|uniref:Uncharacterized protein n=1 Tax=Favolaschia claudopus TaxID=2862362 RepID=A0AAV9Z6D8_9AGAR
MVSKFEIRCRDANESVLATALQSATLPSLVRLGIVAPAACIPITEFLAFISRCGLSNSLQTLCLKLRICDSQLLHCLKQLGHLTCLWVHDIQQRGRRQEHVVVTDYLLNGIGDMVKRGHLRLMSLDLTTVKKYTDANLTGLARDDRTLLSPAGAVIYKIFAGTPERANDILVVALQPIKAARDPKLAAKTARKCFVDTVSKGVIVPKEQVASVGDTDQPNNNIWHPLSRRQTRAVEMISSNRDQNSPSFCLALISTSQHCALAERERLLLITSGFETRRDKDKAQMRRESPKLQNIYCVYAGTPAYKLHTNHFFLFSPLVKGTSLANLLLKPPALKKWHNSSAGFFGRSRPFLQLSGHWMDEE